jgi:flagellar biosynthesis anti-sigma factor FlgM
MKIDGPGRPRFAPTEDAGRVKDAKANKPAAPQMGERVQVSSLGKMLAEARGPDAPDQTRIDRLKEEIDKGTFKVDADRIAEAMIHEEM